MAEKIGLKGFSKDGYPWWLLIGIFSVTTLIFFFSQLVGDAFFWEDFVEYVYPTQTFAARAFAEGRIPEWNPYVFSGMPFLADLQVGFFYPFNRLLSLAVDGDGHLSVWFLQFVVILHFVFAQLGMYKLSRYFKVSSLASFVPAVSFAFSSAMVMHVIHPMVVFHLTWLPWVAFFMLKAIDNKSLSHALAGGLILGGSFLAGHPQTALYEGFFLLLLAIWYIVDRKKKKGADAGSSIEPKAIAFPAILFVVAAGIFAVQLLPTQELSGSALRADATYEYVTEGSMQLSDFGKMVTPDIKGKLDFENQNVYYFDNYDGEISRAGYFYWEKSLYVGLAVLVLSLTAFIVCFDKPIIRFLIFFTVLGTLFSFGSNFFVFDIFYSLPFFDTFRFPIRMMFLVIFGLSLASGFAIDKLKAVAGGGNKKEIIAVNSVLGIVFMIGLFIWSGGAANAISAPEELKDFISGAGGNTLVMLVILAALLAGLYFHKVKDVVAIILLTLFAFIDLYIFGQDFNANPQNGYEAYDAVDKNMVKAFRGADDENFRVNMRLYNPPYMAMKRNQGMVDQIQLIEGYNPLLLDRINPYFPEKKDIHGSLNVRYEIGIDKSQNRPTFYERQSGIAPVWFAGSVVNSSSKEETKKILAERNIEDHREIAVIEKGESTSSIGVYSRDTNAMEYGTIELVSWEEDRLEYEYNLTGGKRVAVFSEIYYPAWKAYVNDEETEIAIANGSLRAIEVPEGKGTIVMEYSSSAQTLGGIITTIFALASILGIVLIERKGKKRVS
ncbi:MAG: YfhO family protein [Candidatus Kapaibacteriales bacterium]